MMAIVHKGLVISLSLDALNERVYPQQFKKNAFGEREREPKQEEGICAGAVPNDAISASE